MSYNTNWELRQCFFHFRCATRHRWFQASLNTAAIIYIRNRWSTSLRKPPLYCTPTVDSAKRRSPRTKSRNCFWKPLPTKTGRRQRLSCTDWPTRPTTTTSGRRYRRSSGRSSRARSGRRLSRYRRGLVQTLNLIEFLLKNGPPSILSSFKYEVYQFKSFDGYNCYDDGVDRGEASTNHP